MIRALLNRNLYIINAIATIITNGKWRFLLKYHVLQMRPTYTYFGRRGPFFYVPFDKIDHLNRNFCRDKAWWKNAID